MSALCAEVSKMSMQVQIRYEVGESLREGVSLFCKEVGLTHREEELKQYITTEDLFLAVAHALGELREQGKREILEIKYRLCGEPIRVNELLALTTVSIHVFYAVVKDHKQEREISNLYGYLRDYQIKTYRYKGFNTPVNELAEKVGLPVAVIHDVFRGRKTKEFTNIPLEVWGRIREDLEKGIPYMIKDRTTTLKRQQEVSGSRYTWGGESMTLKEMSEKLKVTTNILYLYMKKYNTYEITQVPKKEIMVWWSEYTYTHKGRKISLEKIAKKYDMHLSLVVKVFKDAETFELSPSIMKKIQSVIPKKYTYNGKQVSMTEIAAYLKMPPASIKRKCDLYNTTDITWLIRSRKLWEQSPVSTY